MYLYLYPCDQIYGGELYEDNQNYHSIGKRNVKLLKELHPDIYTKIVYNIISTAYDIFPIELINKIIEVCDDPNKY